MPMLKRRGAPLLAALMLMASLTIVGAGAVTQSASANPCAHPGWVPGDNTKYNNMYRENNVPIKNGPYADCTTIATAQMWHDGAMHCYYWNTYNRLWFHIWNRIVQVDGWVHNDNLRLGMGTAWAC